MHTLALIDKYYGGNQEARKILLAHSTQVAKLAVRVATHVERTEAIDIEFIEQAALLHDIGMLYTDTPKLACFGDKPYIVFEDEVITYTEAHAIVRSLADVLATTHGVGQGDRVAIAMRNYPEWACAYWATISLGAAAVGVNAWWTSAELEYGLGDSRPKVVIADDERLAPLPIHAHHLVGWVGGWASGLGGKVK